MALALRAERQASSAAEAAAVAAAAAASARCTALEERCAASRAEVEAISQRLASAVALRKRIGLHLASSIPLSSEEQQQEGNNVTSSTSGGGGALDPLTASTSLWAATDVLGACALGSLWGKHREAVVNTVRGLNSSLHALQSFILGAEATPSSSSSSSSSASSSVTSLGPSNSSYHSAHETLRLSLFRELSSLRGALSAAVEAREASSIELERALSGGNGGGSGSSHVADRIETATVALRELLTALHPALEGCSEVQLACKIERESWIGATLAAGECRAKELEGETTFAARYQQPPLPTHNSRTPPPPPHTHTPT